MFFENTLQDNMVLQRNAENVSEFEFSARSSVDGVLLLSVYKDKKLLAGFDKLSVGKVERGKVSGLIAGLPVGGPYDLVLQVAGCRKKAVYKNLLVGDLWLLAGQSNMADSGFMPSLSETSDMVRAFYMDNTWGVARDPLHDVTRAVAPVHGGNPANPPREKLTFRGTGPGLQFGVEMYKHTGVPQGLIACAHGGTTLAQWDPALKKLGGKSLYGALYERLKMQGGKVAGALWYQGCSDTGTDENAHNYERRTRKVFAAIRRDCKNPQLPIVLVQLAAYIAVANQTHYATRRWLEVRDAQYRIGQTLPQTACVPAIDLGLDDQIHLSNQAVNTLGKRLAEAMLNLRDPECFMPQIAVKSVTFVQEKVLNLAKIRITFDNVVGSLTSTGALPTGFAMVDKDNNYVADAINCTLSGNTATVCLPITKLFFHMYKLAYGASYQPHANIKDQAGRALPCFVIKKSPINQRNGLPLQAALISEAQYGKEDLNSLQLPKNLDELKFSPLRSSLFYLACPREAGKLDKQPKVYIYRYKLKLTEDMTLQVRSGADGAFALYCDRKEIMRHETANPIVLDEFQCDLHLTAGEHEFCCMLSSNSGNAWGYCTRLYRLDKGKVPEFMSLEDMQTEK